MGDWRRRLESSARVKERTQHLQTHNITFEGAASVPVQSSPTGGKEDHGLKAASQKSTQRTRLGLKAFFAQRVAAGTIALPSSSAHTAEPSTCSAANPDSRSDHDVTTASFLPTDLGSDGLKQREEIVAWCTGHGCAATQAVDSIPGTKPWDRKWRGLKITPKLEPEGQEPARVPAEDLLQRHEALHASVVDMAGAAASDEDDLFDWDPKATRLKEKDQHVGRKRGRAFVRESKSPSHLGGRQKKGAARDAAGDLDAELEQAQAAPNFENAPSDGVDEPLVLLAEMGPADGGASLRLEVPGSINRYLREYQREGIRFLFRQYALQQGAILADDMGLGKTVQTIGFVAAILGKTGTAADLQPDPEARQKSILIVAPSSVVTNWQREFSTWGAFRVVIYHGSADSRAAAVQGIVQGTAEILLTTYDTFRINIEEMQKVEWHVAFFDEAHKLKKRSNSIFEAARSLKTKRCYGLTGTAMQNAYEELWTLLHWANPALMGDWQQFSDYYVKPLKMGQKKDATELHVAKAHKRQRELDVLLKRFLLRRTKAIIKDQLPKKTDNIVFCKLAPLQMRAYRRVLNSPDFQLLVRAEEPCNCGSGETRAKCCHTQVRPEEGGVLWPHLHTCTCNNQYDEFDNSKGCKRHKPEGCHAGRLRCPFCLVLPCLTILQKIANHLELIKVDPEDKAMAEDEWALPRAKELAQMVFGEDLAEAAGDTLDRNWLHVSSSAHCGKMAALEQLLHLWAAAGDNKVLVFSHSVKMLNIIEQLVIRSGHNYSRLDGSTKREDRQSLCDAFNHSPSLFLFLISTTAGGLGLNLTAANKVVIIDPSWNPSHDLQAQDRAFRIGQRRDVSVYRLIAAGTLEEMIYTRQVYKQQQSAVATEGSKETRYFYGVQGDLNNKGELFGITNLFKETAEKVRAHEIFDQERKPLHYRIQECDSIDMGAEDAAGEAAAKAEEAAEYIKVEDAGLQQLAQRIQAEALALHGAEAPAPSPNHPPPPPQDQTLDILNETGAMGIHSHDRLLGGTKRDRVLARMAELKHAKELAEEPPQPTAFGAAAMGPAAASAALPKRRSKKHFPAGELAGRGAAEPGRVMSQLESLAAWRGLQVAEMARQLMGMTAEQRLQLRREYAAADHGLMSQPGWSRLYSSSP